jgi:hypothetical protein
MARYKEYSYEQTKLIPIAFSNQILPGTFEYTLNHLIDNEFEQTKCTGSLFTSHHYEIVDRNTLTASLISWPRK